MRKLLLILALFAPCMATQWVWDGGHATNNAWSEPTNWTADAGYPQTAADTVTINSGSDSAIVDVSDTCGPLTIGSSYTGVWYGGTAVLCVAGSFTMGANATPSPGTGTIKIIDAATITTRNKICFYDLTILANTTLADTLKTASGGDILYTAGNITHSGQGIIAGGDVQNNSTGTMNWGNFVTMNAASGTFGIASTCGTQTATNFDMLFNCSTLGTSDFDKATTIKSVTVNGNYTNSSAANLIISNTTSPLTIVNGGTITATGNWTLRTTGSCQFIKILSGSPTFAGSGAYSLNFASTNNISDTLEGITSASNFSVVNYGYPTGAKVYYKAGLNIGNLSITQNGAGNPNHTFLGDLSCGNLGIGVSASTTDKIVVNFGNGNHSFSSYGISGWNGDSAKINWGRSTRTCAGNLVYYPNQMYLDTGTLIKTGSTASITNLAGKRIYNLIIRKNRGIVDSFPTTAGLDSINDFTIDSGKVRQKKKPLWINNYFNYASAAGDTVNFDTTVEVRGDWRSFGNRKTDGLNSLRIFTGTASPCTTAMSGIGGYFIWRRAKGSVLVDSGVISKAMFSMDSIGTLKTMDSTFIDSLVLCDSTTLMLKSGNGFKARALDTATINGVAGKLNYYSASSAGSAARLYLPAVYTMSYTKWQDITVSPVDQVASNGTNINGGGNTGFAFSETGGSNIQIRINQRSHVGVRIR